MRSGKAIAAACAVVLLGVALWLLMNRPGSDRAGRGDDPAVATQAATTREATGAAPRALTVTSHSEPEAESRGGVEIEVVLASGRPVPSAIVVVFRGEDVLLSAKTDSRGVACMAASSGEARVVAFVPGAQLLLATIALTPGRTRLAVPDGLEISGIVKFRDGAPPSTVGLDLWKAGGPADRFDFELPRAVRKVFDYRLRAGVNWQTDTDELGRFSFIGLPAGFVGRIHADLPYRTTEVREGSEKVTDIRAPTKSVTVIAERYAVISGRVVDATTGAPIGSAPVNVSWESPPALAAGSAMLSGTGMRTGDDGRFELPIQMTTPLIALKVSASARDGTDETTVVIEDRFDQDHDVGDVKVGAGRLVRLLVKDEAGQPIANARATPKICAKESITPPTDSEGRGEIRLTHEESTILVGAFRYQTVTVPVPADLSGILEVTLPTGAALTVKSVAGGVPAPGVRVEVTSRTWVFPGTMGNPTYFHLASGMTLPSGNRQDERGVGASFVAEADGVVRLSLPPGVPIRVEVVDQAEAPQFSDEIKLAKGEDREITVTLGTPPRRFAGRVVDSAGSPVSGATVGLAKTAKDLEGDRHRYAGPHTATTDRSGGFSFAAVSARTTNVRISRSGYATLIAGDVAVPDDGSEVLFTLSPAMRVRVIVKDSSGEPVTAPLEVSGEMPGFPPSRPRQEKPGTYLFDEFGAGSLVVRVKAGNGAWTKSVDTRSQTEVRITVPVLGRLKVKWDPSLQDPADRHLVRAKPDDPSATDLFAYVEPGTSEAAFDLVAPATYAVEVMIDPRKQRGAGTPKTLASGRVTVAESPHAELVLERR